MEAETETEEEEEERLKVMAGKKKGSDLYTAALHRSENSLIISLLFFDAFARELISLITRVNY